MLNFDIFYKKYLIQIKENTFFDNLEKILILNVSLSTKQRRIEKLTNVYLLKKSEETFELNPLWSNKINNVFLNELILFKNLYHYMLIDLKKNLFDPINLSSLFTYREVFHISIYSYFLCINSNTKINLDYSLILKSTWHTKVRENLYTYFESKIKYFYTYHFIESIKNSYHLHESFTMECLKYNIEYGKNVNYKLVLLSVFGKKDYKNILSQFDSYIMNHIELIHRFLNKISLHLVDIFININILKKFTKKVSKKTYDYLNVFNLDKFNELNLTCYFSSQLPMIVNPIPWNKKGYYGGFLLNKKNDYMPLVKPLKDGKSNIKISKYFIDTINLVQDKCYQINTTFLEYTKTNLFLKTNKICNELEIYNLFLKFKKYEASFYALLNKHSYKVEYIELFFDKKKELISTKKYKNALPFNKKLLLENLINKWRITNKIISDYKTLNDLEASLFKSINLFLNHSYIIKISELFKKNDLYMVNRSDFRGRFFPVGRGPHRASGDYKYLLYSKEDLFIYDEHSLNHLKQATSLYFKTFIEYKVDDLYRWFNTHICIHQKNNTFKKKVLCFIKLFIKEKLNDSYKQIVSNNEIDIYINNIICLIYKSKDTSLFILCLLEYFNYECNNYYNSFFTLDIDQCSSGPMIYSLLSGDKEMALLTNCISNKHNIKYDLYYHFIKELKLEMTLLLKTNQNNNKKIVIKHILNIYDSLFNRNFSKMLIMPTFYNMGQPGIKSLLLETLFHLNFHSESLTFLKNNTNIFLSLMINLLSKTLKIKYKNTISYQENLVNTCKVLFKSNNSIYIKTLDGSFISYNYYKRKDTYVSIYIKQKKYSHRIFLPIYDKNNYALSEKHYITFPPNWIHSIDASLCKIILNIHYLFFKKTLEPLHDSFRIRLKNINSFKNIIKYVYLFYFFNSFFHEKKIGIIWKNKELIIEINSEKYIEYKKYLPYNSEKIDIYHDTFENNLNTNKDIELLIKKRIYKRNEFSNKEIYDFLSNEFMFYF